MNYQLKQIVVPFHKIPKKLLNYIETKRQLQKLGWREFKVRGQSAGFWSPYYGSNRHVAVVEARINNSGKIIKIERFLYDQMERADGPINSPYGHSTPNAMVVVLEETANKQLLVHSVREWRPFIYDHLTKKKGVTVVGITGKWAKKIGDNPAKTALNGLLEDMGIEVEKASFKKIGMHTPNRAWVETCNVVYVAKFKRKVIEGKGILNADDIVKEGKKYLLSEFPIGPDALVNSALWMVAKKFNLISSKISPTLTNKTTLQ